MRFELSLNPHTLDHFEIFIGGHAQIYLRSRETRLAPATKHHERHKHGVGLGAGRPVQSTHRISAAISHNSLTFPLAIPDAAGVKRSILTADLIKTMLALQQRLGADAQAILEPPYSPPEGLNAALIKAWLSGGVKTARAEHVGYVLKSWGDLEAMATCLAGKSGITRIPLTADIRAKLRAEADRTDYAWKALVKLIEPRPAGLTEKTLGNWVNGHIKTARADHVEAVLAAYAALPDATTLERKQRLPSTRSGPRLQFTKDHREVLRKERERTGVSAKALCELAGDDAPPAGIHAGLINGWINSDPATVSKDDYDWALRAWRALPDKRKPPPPHAPKAATSKPGTNNRRAFSKADLAELIAQRARTGVMPTRLIHDLQSGDMPEGITPGLVTGWINNPPRTVRADQFEWVLNAWKALPDAAEDR